MNDIKIKLQQTQERWRAVKARFSDYGLSVTRYSPGNGHTKYRIFSVPTADYFNTDHSAFITHMTGIGHVEAWINAFERGIHHERTSNAIEAARIFDIPLKEEHDSNS
tara:strand:- start:231 stop:554 length:324 start_codon:yes stop_codon:yes gene_type:complete